MIGNRGTKKLQKIINSQRSFSGESDVTLEKKTRSVQETQSNVLKKKFRQKQMSNVQGIQNFQNITKKNGMNKKPSMKVAFLGGLNEIGKNITCFECQNDMVIFDCGMSFPDEQMFGIDLVLPDFSYIEGNTDKIRGLFITHGHEDHIGAIPYLLKKINVPIFATKLTAAIIRSKLREFGLHRKAKINVVNPGRIFRLGCMSIEPIRVNHSVPDAVGAAIHSPAGIFVHTGDFKIDFTPLNEPSIDLLKFASLGQQGVTALFADSTNADRSGYTMTEQKVIQAFENLFNMAKNKRIIIASFASNISRLHEIVLCAAKFGRKVAFSGRSMINYMTIAAELGYLKFPENIIVDIDALKHHAKEKVVLITTGSQGESMSALARMASSDHRQVTLGYDDFVIISANPIPGNEKTISEVVNSLIKLGCEVIYKSIHEVHVSGHACQEELKIIHALTKPKFFVPVHGEQLHLRNHASIAKAMGMLDSRMFIGNVGALLEIDEDQMKQIGTVQSGQVFVDGSGIGDVGNLILKERRHLAEDGLIVVTMVINSEKSIILGPSFFSKGFIFVKESGQLMRDARKKVTEIFQGFKEKSIREHSILKVKLRDDLAKFFYKQTKRSPMVIPIIMVVDE
ncbi:MAG: ribonuclease J [Oscillospiraceae bacterium]|nr:ribonuclease J [Oscillospiraceae bacterium]